MTLNHWVGIEKYKGKRGTTYSVRWHCPRTNRRVSRSCGAGEGGRRAAGRFAARIKDELHRGRMGDPIEKPWTEFRSEFLDIQRAKKRPATVVRYEKSFDTFEKLCNPATVLSVTSLMVEQFITERAKTVRPATVNCDLRHLRAAMEKARIWFHLPGNPFDAVEHLRVHQKELRILGADEVAALLETCRTLSEQPNALRWEAFIYLAVTCGFRRGELLNLRWQDVDLPGLLIKLTCREEWQTKSGKNRVAFLDAHSVNLLDSLRKQQAAKLRIAEFVFVSEEGNCWGKNLSRDFQCLVARSKLPHFTLHDLRRTFCSALANANVQEAVVQKLAGHASMTTTLQYYTRIDLGTARQAAKALPYRVGQEPTESSILTGSTPEVRREVS